MIKIITTVALAITTIVSYGQLAPQASPVSKIEQRVGLTDIQVTYSRPSKNDRVIFGGLLPYGEVWRTGANENSKLTTSDVMIFGKDTLKAGTYAIYTIPNKDAWDLIFYTDYSNWGTPEKWDDSKVALKVKSAVKTLNEAVESLTIDFQNFETTGADLIIKWDNVQVSFPFQVPTDAKVMANIQKTMAGPSARDYNSAAQYYLNNKKDLKQALAWSTKACELNPEAFYMFRTKSLIQAELGDKKGAIDSAKKGLELAKKANNTAYISMFEESLKNWGK